MPTAGSYVLLEYKGHCCRLSLRRSCGVGGCLAEQEGKGNVDITARSFQGLYADKGARCRWDGGWVSWGLEEGAGCMKLEAS